MDESLNGAHESPSTPHPLLASQKVSVHPMKASDGVRYD